MHTKYITISIQLSNLNNIITSYAIELRALQNIDSFGQRLGERDCRESGLKGYTGDTTLIEEIEVSNQSG